MRAFRFGLIFCILGGLSLPGLAQRGFITTCVGPGLPVNRLPAITQDLGRIYALALDRAGGFYVASESQNRIYRVLADGTIHHVAGSGTAGFSGDGGPAILAKLLGPCGIVLDSAGNLYVADTFNLRIRKITPEGIIRTVAGNGTVGFSGDGGPALAAQLSYPYDLAVDSAGILYIADVSNHCIRRVSPEGIITTVAGTGVRGFNGDGIPATSAQLNNPDGIAFDAAGNLFIADTSNHRIRRITPEGMIETVAGNGTAGYTGNNGPAASAQLHLPVDVAIDASGSLYIADFAKLSDPAGHPRRGDHSPCRQWDRRPGRGWRPRAGGMALTACS
jgi:sugar lactone lactonase YvrE